MHYQTFDVSPHFLVSGLEQEKELGLSPQEVKHVNALWRERKSVQPKLTNHKLLSFVSFNGVQLIGQRVPYKYYVAQEADAKLKERLQIEPISLSGVSHYNGSILVGRRSSSAFQFPGHFEAVPSVVLSSRANKLGHINIEREMMRELKEETGIASPKAIRPRALVHDAALGLYEICFDLEVESEVARRVPTVTNKYQQLQWVTKDELAALLRNEKWVPFSLFLLKILPPSFL